MNFNITFLMINRKSIVNSPDDRLRQFSRMPIPSTCAKQKSQQKTRAAYLGKSMWLLDRKSEGYVGYPIL